MRRSGVLRECSYKSLPMRQTVKIYISCPLLAETVILLIVTIIIRGMFSFLVRLCVS